MRTAPVVVLTQAAIVLDVGAAMAAVPAKSNAADNSGNFREDMDPSGERLWIGDPVPESNTDLRVRG
jgi:hypothetical protein